MGKTTPSIPRPDRHTVWKFGIARGAKDIGESMTIRLFIQHDVITGPTEKAKAKAGSTTCRLLPPLLK